MQLAIVSGLVTQYWAHDRNPSACHSIRHFCCRVVDTLPKHWGGRGPAAIPEQLSAKANSAAVLLDTLQHARVLDQLPPVAQR